MTENLPEKKKPGFRLTAKRIGWLLLLLVWAVGILMIWYGQAKLAEVEVKKQEVQKNSLLATQELAKLAGQAVLWEVRPKVKANNLGAAREQLKNAADLVAVISTLVLPEQTQQVGEIRNGIQQALEALDSDPKQADVLLDQVGQQLSVLSGENQGE